MKVAQVLYSGLGGHGSVVFSLLGADKEAILKNELIFYGIEPLLPEYKDRCRILNIPYTFIRPKVGNPLTAWIQLFKQILKTDADVVVLHSVNTILPVLLAIQLKRKKLIVVEHLANSLKTKFERFCSFLSMKTADSIVVLTQVYYNELKSLLQKQFIDRKVHIIPNGIDTNLYCAVEKLNRTEFVFGMVSRFTASKDHLSLVCAFKELNHKYPNTQLMLAGDGETMTSIKQIVKDWSLEASVIFNGMLQEKDLISFYHSLDVYVHISKGETMSTAIMQAMSCGLPVLASNVSGINNMVPKDAGLLVENSVPVITEAMKKLYENFDLREKFKENTKNYAMSHFSSTKMLKKYLSLFIVST